MKRFICCLVVALRLGAQDDDHAAQSTHDWVRDWVHDSDPRHRAWAAHWIAGNHLTSFAPDLIKNLKAYSPSDNAGPLRPEDAAIQAVADALIRLGVDVPESAVMNLYPRLAAQTMILLAKASGDRSDALYRIFNETKLTDVWLASANLLAAKHPERIAKLLMDKFTLTSTLRVVEPDSVQGGSWNCGGGCSVGFGVGPPYGKDWPSIWEYSVEAGSRENIPLLAPGRTDVYYSHWESTDYIPHPQSNACDSREQLYIRGLLEQLIGSPPDGLPLPSQDSEVLVFYSEAQFLQKATDLLLSDEGRFDDIVRALAKQGLLTSAEAAAAQLHMTMIVDDRTKRSSPLPTIDLAGLGILQRNP